MTVEDVILEGAGGGIGGRSVLMRVVADITLFMSDSVLISPCTYQQGSSGKGRKQLIFKSDCDKIGPSDLWDSRCWCPFVNR